MTAAIQRAFTPVLVLVCLAGIIRPVEAAAARVADTLYTESRAMDIYISDPDGALNIIDSAVVVGNLSDRRADYLRACVYFQDEARKSLSDAICERLLKEEDEQTDLNEKLDVRELLLYSAKIKGDYSGMLRYTIELSELYHDAGMQAKESLMRAEAGYAMLNLGDEKGLPLLDEAITELDGILSFSALDASLMALKLKLHYFDNAGMPEGVVSVGERMLRKLQDFDSHPEDYGPDESSNGISSPEGRAQYLDFYRSQTYAFLACGYSAIGDMARGRQFARLFDGTLSGKSLDQRKLMLNAWGNLGEYDRMEKTAAELRDTWGADTLTHNYAVLLKLEAQAAEKRGDLRGSIGLLKRYETLIEALYFQQNKAEAASYAVKYNMQENEMARRDAEARLERNRLLIGALALLVLLGVWFSLYFLSKRVQLSRMNHALSEQISEALRYKDKYYEETARKIQVKTVSDSSGKIGEAELFELLSGAIIKEQLFLDSSFGRQSLIDRFGVTKDDIGKAFAAGGTSLPAFIGDCRLDYACHLLKERLDLGIDDIAQASGYTLRRSFSRSFKAKYAINPSDYRQQSQSTS